LFNSTTKPAAGAKDIEPSTGHTSRMSDRFDEDDYEAASSSFAESFFNNSSGEDDYSGSFLHSHRDSNVVVGVGLPNNNNGGVVDDLPEIASPHSYDADYSTTDDESRPMMEIADGICLPLRSSIETWEAIKEGRITVTSCIICTTDLHVIEDAKYVVCPGTFIHTSRRSEGMNDIHRSNYLIPFTHTFFMLSNSH
jgi:hypothetical protein